MATDIKERVQSTLQMVPPLLAISSAFALSLSVAYQVGYFMGLGSVLAIGELNLNDFVNHTAFAVILCMAFGAPAFLFLGLGKERASSIAKSLRTRKAVFWCLIVALVTPPLFCIGAMLLIGWYRPLAVTAVAYFALLCCHLYIFKGRPKSIGVFRMALDVALMLLTMVCMTGSFIGSTRSFCPKKISLLADTEIRGTLIAALDRSVIMRIDGDTGETIIPWAKINRYTVHDCGNFLSAFSTVLPGDSGRKLDAKVRELLAPKQNSSANGANRSPQGSTP